MASAARGGRWRLQYDLDFEGSEILIMIPQGGENAADGAQDKPYHGENTMVMMEWERPYMEELVSALKLREDDTVLEIGFGCGYDAFLPHHVPCIEEDETRGSCIHGQTHVYMRTYTCMHASNKERLSIPMQV